MRRAKTLYENVIEVPARRQPAPEARHCNNGSASDDGVVWHGGAIYENAPKYR